MWHAMVLAHFVALNKTLESNDNTTDPHKGCIRHLSEQAAKLSEYEEVTKIHDWLKRKTDYLKKANLQY